MFTDTAPYKTYCGGQQQQNKPFKCKQKKKNKNKIKNEI
jgi:hypothetical protein